MTKTEQHTQDKLDEILILSRAVNQKVDRLGQKITNLDERLSELERRMDKFNAKSVLYGGLGGLVVTVGIELIKAKFGG